MTESEPLIREVLSFEPLPPGQRGSCRAVVRWSDGRIAEALRWWADEVLICDGDHENSWLMVSRGEIGSGAGWIGS